MFMKCQEIINKVQDKQVNLDKNLKIYIQELKQMKEYKIKDGILKSLKKLWRKVNKELRICYWNYPKSKVIQLY